MNTVVPLLLTAATGFVLVLVFWFCNWLAAEWHLLPWREILKDILGTAVAAVLFYVLLKTF